MGKFDNAYFDFSIEPEDSKFLKSWNELRNDEGFQKKLRELKNHLQKNEMSLTISYNMNDVQTKSSVPLQKSDWHKTIYKMPNKSYQIRSAQTYMSRKYTKLDKKFENRFRETIQTASHELNDYYESGTFPRVDEELTLCVV